jgi:flavin reductase (DIM6/NTAB) family NADH-FMN oxidoreductase RutF
MGASGLAGIVAPVSAAERTFAALVGQIDYPMFIVTARVGDELAGCLVGFATQCSIDPPRFAVCLSDKNRTYRLARKARELAVHLVAADAAALAELFGGETGDEVDKFSRCAWHPGPRGLPLLDDCPSWFAGDVLDRIDAGDHTILLLTPFDGRAAGGGQFEFHRARRIEPGHEA